MNTYQNKYNNKPLNKITIFCFSVFLFFSFINRSVAQNDIDLALAQEYYSQGDYDKAYTLYSKLAQKQQYVYDVHKNYFDVLQKLQKYEEAEKYIRKQTKAYPQDGLFVIDYAILLNLQGKTKESGKQLDDFIDRIKKDDNQIRYNAQYLIQANFYEYAEKLYLFGRKNGREKFVYELAAVYGLSGKLDKMTHEYLDMLSYSPENAEYVQQLLQMRVRDEEDFEKLETTLVDFLQKYPEKIVYPEMLVWYFLQRKEFNKAFMQAKALDKRKALEGSKLVELGEMTMQHKDYAVAIKIYDYLATTYTTHPEIYPFAKRSLAKAKEEQIKTTFPIDIEKIKSLVNDYKSILVELGLNANTAESARNMALLQAFYLNNKDTAVVVLQSIIDLKQRGIRQELISQAKIDLGDIYLLKSEPWESTLLYSQVAKTEKERPLGHIAKLKNAKLNYYKGDFEFAKEQLDVLKEATTREIANDAMQLSLLISDNLELDTSAAPLTEFAAIELLIFQGQIDNALNRYTQMLKDYPEHSLTDEIHWAKSQLLIQKAQYKEALTELEKILKDYPEDILGDDANFMIGKLYDENLNNKDTAMEYYQKLLTNYQGSIYSAEARKRFRKLRGDAVN
jgi:predicted Zn-dependent protease